MAGLFKKKPKKAEEKEPKPPCDEMGGGTDTPSAKPDEKPKKSLFGSSKKPKKVIPEYKKPKEKKAKEKKPKEKKLKKKIPEYKKAKEKKPKEKKLKEQKPGEEAPVTEMPEVAPAAVEPGAEQPAKKGLFKKKGGKKPAGPKPVKARTRKGGFGGSKYSPVGLDLGRSSITAVRLQHQTGGSAILQAALDQLPEGIISEGEVVDVDALAQALKNFWKTYKIKGRKVALGLASQKVVVRTLDFPVLDKKELRSAIEFQAQDYIPIPIDEAVFDFHILGRLTAEDGLEKQKVLVVAAQKMMVMNFVDAVKKARLTIDTIDLQAFAMLRSYSPRSFLDEGAPSGNALAVVNIASDVTNMIIEANGQPQFTRITSFGGDNFTNAVVEQTGVTFQEAETLKAMVGLPEPGKPRPETGPEGAGGVEPWTDGGGASDDEPPGGDKPPEEGDFPAGPPSGGEGQPAGDEDQPAGGEDQPAGGEPPEEGPVPAGEEPTDTGAEEEEAPAELSWPEVPDSDEDEEKRIIIQRALEMTAESFADELRRSLDYYMSQDDSLPIGRLLLGGGGALLPHLDEHLTQLFPFPVEIGDPLVRIRANKSDLTDEELKALAPRLAIAIGLALEDEE